MCKSKGHTVEPGDSKPVDSKLQEFVNFLLLTKIRNHSINHMIDSKHLAIVNIFALLKKFTKARLDCIIIIAISLYSNEIEIHKIVLGMV